MPHVLETPCPGPLCNMVLRRFNVSPLPKVYYASEVTDGNKKTTFNREMGEQPLPENTAATRSDRYTC